MPIDRAAISSEFARRELMYKRLLEESFFILKGGLSSTGVKYHSIPARVKTLNSFLTKAERKDELADPFADITDIVGLRVVCLFLSDITRVGEVVKSHFEVISEDDKIEGADISSFGYMSVHFVAKMKKTYSGPRYEGLAEMPFEIQARTIAMDAWATISHYLDYKSDIDVPRTLKRDFYALSGLFYVADSHFEMFFKERERSRIEITAEIETGKPGLDQEVNLDTLKAYLWSKFPDRDRNESNAISELVSELHSSGYKQLSQLDEAIEQGYHAFLAYEKDRPPHSGDRFGDVGVVRILLSIYDEFYRASRFNPQDYVPYQKLPKIGPKRGEAGDE